MQTLVLTKRDNNILWHTCTQINTTTICTLQPSHKRPPPTSEVSSSKDNEQGDPPEVNHVGGAHNADTVDDEGIGSEIRLDRPSSAKGSRKRAPPDNEAAPPVNGRN